MRYSYLQCLVLLSFSQGVFGTCKSRFGTTCLTKEDPGARVYFDYFQWNSTCFSYEKGQFCMVHLGYLQPCKCSRECQCQETLQEGANELKCDSSSVKDYGTCLNAKKTFCPLTLETGGQIVQNTLCQYCGENRESCGGGRICDYGIVSQGDKDDIVRIHNDLRSKVSLGQEKRGVEGPQPPATNMHKLQWDEDLALSAQTWALQCPRNHDQNRLTPQFSNYPYVWVSQNLAFLWSSSLNTSRGYEEMILGWYDEVKDFPPANVGGYSKKGATGVVGHYTTMIWATTTKVGCGFVHHYDSLHPNNPYKKTFVCNYGEGGNIQGKEVYKAGKPGSDCLRGSENSLCI